MVILRTAVNLRIGRGGRSCWRATGSYVTNEVNGTEPTAFVPDAADDCWAIGIRVLGRSAKVIPHKTP